MRNLIPVVGLILLSFSACQPKMQTPKGDFTIHAEVEGVDTIIFEKIEANNLLLVDTLFAKNGEFVTANSIDGSAFFILRTPEGEGINLLIEKGEQLEISGQRIDWANNYSIEGSKGSNQILELNNKLNTFEVAIDLIYEEAKEAQKEDFEDIQKRFNSIFEEHSNYLKSFIDTNLNSKVAILALFQAVKGENILNLHTDYEYYEKVATSFQNNWPNSTHTQLLKDVVKMAFAQDFSMLNPNGDSVSLNEYKGKLILLDFWASWCRPCRAANPKMVELYNKYNKKGLEMISISLDGTPQQSSPKQDWMNAIKEDKLSWTQISELKGWESEIRNKYAFRSIPFTVLIDTNGRIIGENLPEEFLDSKIAKLLKQ
jgi:thiol-disulfide isomerase/thioredoxin